MTRIVAIYVEEAGNFARDIVDTDFHAPCEIGTNSDKYWYLDIVWKKAESDSVTTDCY